MFVKEKHLNQFDDVIVQLFHCSWYLLINTWHISFISYITQVFFFILEVINQIAVNSSRIRTICLILFIVVIFIIAVCNNAYFLNFFKNRPILRSEVLTKGKVLFLTKIIQNVIFFSLIHKLMCSNIQI